MQLTWDETDHDRVTALNRNFNKSELLDMDFNAYLASSSEEEEDDKGGIEFGGQEEGDDDNTAEGETETRDGRRSQRPRRFFCDEMKQQC